MFSSTLSPKWLILVSQCWLDHQKSTILLISGTLSVEKYYIFSFHSYNVCIRPEDGFCCIQYQVCSDTGSFSLSSIQDPAIAADAKSLPESSCSSDYIDIPGKYQLKILSIWSIYPNPWSNKQTVMVFKCTFYLHIIFYGFLRTKNTTKNIVYFRFISQLQPRITKC